MGLGGIFKKTGTTEGSTLKDDEYLSEAAKEILSPKYKSSISEMQRTVTYSRRSVAKQPYDQAKAVFFKALTVWFKGQVKFEGVTSVTPGQRLAPVFDGVKEILIVTNATAGPDGVKLTFYNESEHRLTWTTFSLSRGFFNKDKAVFTMRQHHCSNYVHERMSPLGQSNSFIMRREFSRAFREFVKVYENEAKTCRSPKPKPSDESGLLRRRRPAVFVFHRLVRPERP